MTVIGLLWWLLILISRTYAAVEYRLIERSSNSGILQVKTTETTTWGTVCANSYDVNDATVICRSLGMNHTDARPLTVDYKKAYSPVVLNTLECKGDEQTLASCRNANIGVKRKCPQNRIVKVYCDEARENQFRLMGGKALSSGRVELFMRGSWGTIHVQDPNDVDAQVLCRSLGFPFKMARFLLWNRGTGEILTKDVLCKGDEPDWLSCQLSYYSFPSSYHFKDVAVSCEDLRLVNIKGINSGVLEGYYSDEWRPVYSNVFDNLAASVACRVLGLPRSGAEVDHLGNQILSSIERTVLHAGVCSGDEKRLTRCQASRWIPSLFKNVVITCKSVDLSKVKFRLHEMNNGFVGRLEVFAKNNWGTVCNSGVTNQTAAVACRTLGLPSEHALVVPSEYVPEGRGNIWIQGLECKGTEQSLLDCDWNPWSTGRCYHYDDLDIYCGHNANEFKIRLVDGADDNSGRVEVLRYGVWHRLCINLASSSSGAVCRQLGKPSVAAKATSCFEEGTEPFLMKNFYCESSEANLEECGPTWAYRHATCESSLKVICSDEYVDDTNCFRLDSWVYVVICVGIAIVLFIICITVKSRYKGGCGRRAANRRADVYSVQMTNIPNSHTAELVTTPSAPADPPPYSGTPPYSDPPPSYTELFDNKEDETPA